MPDWYISDSAIKAMARVLRLRTDDASLDKAENRLRELIPLAHHVRTDRAGRQMWRTKGSDGTRMVVDFRADQRGKLIWVGNGRPPAEIWDEPEPHSQARECPHLPTTGAVFMVTITQVATPSREAASRTETKWEARVCAACAEGVRLSALGR